MKLLLISISLIIAQLTFAQKPEEIEAIFWGENDPYGDILEIDSSLENESAVVIGRTVYYSYENRGKKYEVIEAKRDRVKILDKSALEYYSEFSFTENFKNERSGWSIKNKKGQMFFGVKIIKADGTEEIIDQSQAVELESDDLESFKKIAIPNLEIGDIVDFFYYTVEPFVNTLKNGYVFAPEITLVSSVYPINNLDIELIAEKDFVVNFNSYNGAPKVKKEEVEGKGKTKYSYKFNEDNINKIEYKRWVNKYRELPTIKFQVIHSLNEKGKKVDGFVGEINGVNKSISKDGLKEYLSYYLDKTESKISSKEQKSLIKYGANEDKLDFLYGFFHSRRFYHNIHIYGSDDEIIRAAKLNAFLKQWGYNYDFLAIPHHNYADKNSILFPQELTYMFVVYDLLEDDKPLYLTAYDLLYRAGDIPVYLQGQDAFIYADDKLTVTTIPTTSATKNFESSTIEVEIHEDLNNVTINAKNSFGGDRKYIAHRTWINFNDYYKNEKSIKSESSYKAKKGKENWYNPLSLLLVSLANDIDENKLNEVTKEKVISDITNSLEVELNELQEKYFEYDVIHKGLSPFVKEENLVTTYSFETTDLISKAGRNYIFPVGLLIGGQVALEEDEIEERLYDAFVESAKSFQNKIIITIPDGYTVKGLEDLRYEVKNEAGSFMSKATIEDDKIVIESIKSYYKKVVSKEDWNDMVLFLEAAYDFTQKKLLITKE